LHRIQQTGLVEGFLVPAAQSTSGGGEPEPFESSGSGAQAGVGSKAAVFDLVYAQVWKLAGRRDDVEELAQAAAEQVLRSLPRFRGRCSLSTWTFRICYLTICKHDRWYRRWLRRFSFTPDGELPEEAAEDPGAESGLARQERLVRLRSALDRLSAKRRAVVVMHDIEEMTIDEIAEVVGAAPVAVRSRLRGGRKMLAEILAEDPYFGDHACKKGPGR
jgi:RNA polymerase sigma-70 factor (ECF subfamily)